MPSGVLGMVCVWAAAWLASHGDVLGNFYVAPLALRETADFRTVFIEVWSRSRTLDTTPYNSGTPPGSALCETRLHPHINRCYSCISLVGSTVGRYSRKSLELRL